MTSELVCAGCGEPITPGQPRLLVYVAWSVDFEPAPTEPDKAYHGFACAKIDTPDL